MGLGLVSSNPPSPNSNTPKFFEKGKKEKKRTPWRGEEGGGRSGRGGNVKCYLRICDLFFDLLSYMTTPALVVLPVVVKFVALRLQSDRWMWRVSTLMHIWCMAQVCA